jgi:hypothetical protein
MLPKKTTTKTEALSHVATNTIFSAVILSHLAFYILYLT